MFAACVVAVMSAVLPTAALPVALAAPPGPSLSWTQWPGGLTVHITDRSGIASWCTYATEQYLSPQFFLDANGTYDLVISPSSPDDHLWHVNVKCDNGSSTLTTYNYIQGNSCPDSQTADSSGVCGCAEGTTKTGESCVMDCPPGEAPSPSGCSEWGNFSSGLGLPPRP
jgi:hypothetical protein